MQSVRGARPKRGAARSRSARVPARDAEELREPARPSASARDRHRSRQQRQQSRRPLRAERVGRAAFERALEPVRCRDERSAQICTRAARTERHPAGFRSAAPNVAGPTVDASSRCVAGHSKVKVDTFCVRHTKIIFFSVLLFSHFAREIFPNFSLHFRSLLCSPFYRIFFFISLQHCQLFHLLIPFVQI